MHPIILHGIDSPLSTTIGLIFWGAIMVLVVYLSRVPFKKVAPWLVTALILLGVSAGSLLVPPRPMTELLPFLEAKTLPSDVIWRIAIRFAVSYGLFIAALIVLAVGITKNRRYLER